MNKMQYCKRVSEAVSVGGKNPKYGKAILTRPGESPGTFNGEDLRKVRDNHGRVGNVKCKFYTGGDPNSEYIMTDTGSVRRIKGDQGRGDDGLHGWCDMALFHKEVTDGKLNSMVKFFLKFNRKRGESERLHFSIDLKGGSAYLWVQDNANGGRWTCVPEKMFEKQGTILKCLLARDPLPDMGVAPIQSGFVTEPKVGLEILEISFDFSEDHGHRPLTAYHNGHAVCHIEKQPFKMVEKGYNKMKGIGIRDLNEDRLIGIRYKCPPFGKVLDSIKREADVNPSSGVYVTVKDLVKDGYYWPIEGITKSSIRMNAVCLDGYGKKMPKGTISLKDLERAFKQFGDRNAGCVLSRDFWGIDDYYLPHETGGVFSYMLIENRDNKDQPDILLITDSIEFSLVYDGEKDKFDISRFRQMDDDPPPNANVSATKDGQYRSSAERRMPLRAMSEQDRQIYYWVHMLDEAFG